MDNGDKTQDQQGSGGRPDRSDSPTGRAPSGPHTTPETTKELDPAESVAHWTRRLTIATGALVFVGLFQFGTGLLQWSSMRGQLAIMQSDERGAAAQLRSARALESDTRNLASAAADQSVAARNLLTELGGSVAVAQQAANAAKAQAGVMRIQERASIVFDRLELRAYARHDSNKPPIWQVLPYIENAGATETRGMRYWGGIGIGYSGGQNPPWPAKTEKFVPAFLGPHQQMSLAEFDTGGDQIIRDAQILVWGQVIYKDIFGSDRRSDFCYIARMPTVDYTVAYSKPIIAQSIPCQHHNCTDDECKVEDAQTEKGKKNVGHG